MRAFRDIERSDLEKGYMELLSQLTKAPAVSQEVFEGTRGGTSTASLSFSLSLCVCVCVCYDMKLHVKRRTDLSLCVCLVRW